MTYRDEVEGLREFCGLYDTFERDGVVYTVIGYERFMLHLGFIPSLICKYKDKNGNAVPQYFGPDEILPSTQPAMQQL